MFVELLIQVHTHIASFNLWNDNLILIKIRVAHYWKFLFCSDEIVFSFFLRSTSSFCLLKTTLLFYDPPLLPTPRLQEHKFILVHCLPHKDCKTKHLSFHKASCSCVPTILSPWWSLLVCTLLGSASLVEIKTLRQSLANCVNACLKIMTAHRYSQPPPNKKRINCTPKKTLLQEVSLKKMKSYTF